MRNDDSGSSVPGAHFCVWLDLPPKCLHPNWIMSHSGRFEGIRRSRASKRYKADVATLTKQVLRCQRLDWHRVVALATFVFPRKVRRDPNNLEAWIKYAWDGLVTGGLLRDDDEIAHLPTKIEIDPGEPIGKLRIDVWRRDDATDSLR